MNNIFLEEMEVLQSIYEDELVILESDHKSAEVKLTIHPNTADDQDGKYVCLTLHFCFTFCSKSAQNYPNKEPHILIKNPRGLADSHLASIDENLKSLAASMAGEQMLYSLVEYAKDSLTDNNHPSCNCPICLEKFGENDIFFRTACYHYFHRKCIKSYIEIAEKVVCPVCRLEFQVDESILNYNDNHYKENDENYKFVPGETFINWRRKCDVLYEKQRKNGGIIDLEFEKNKYLVTQAQVDASVSESLISNYNETDIANDIVTKDGVDFPNTGSGRQSPNPGYGRETPNPYGRKPKPVRTNSPNLKYNRTGSPKSNIEGRGSHDIDNHSARLKNLNISGDVRTSPKDKRGTSSYYNKDKPITTSRRKEHHNNPLKREEYNTTEDKVSNNDGLKAGHSGEASNSIKSERTPRNRNNYKYRENNYEQRDNYQKKGYEQANNYDSKHNVHSSKHKTRRRQDRVKQGVQKSDNTLDKVTNTDELPEIKCQEEMPPPALQIAPPGLQRAPPGLQRAPPGLQKAHPGLCKQVDNVILTSDDMVHSFLEEGNLTLSDYAISKENAVIRDKGDVVEH